MNEKTTIEAKILGKYYTITADEPEEYIYKIFLLFLPLSVILISLIISSLCIIFTFN